jgi:hypothetical protein
MKIIGELRTRCSVMSLDRRDLFQELASRLGMNPAIVEKDFWVCSILKLLFAEPALKNQMVFKGGTGLSKVFGLIDRFSEDIDLVLDWRLLGYDQKGANDPYQATSSKTQQGRHNQEMNARAVAYIRDTLLSQLNHLFASITGVVARIDENDPHTVNVFYPTAFEAGYIRPAVRLEIGPLASWVPSNSHIIKAYALTLQSDVQRQPSARATAVRIASITCTLYAMFNWFGTVSKSVSASAIASSFRNCSTLRAISRKRRRSSVATRTVSFQ